MPARKAATPTRGRRSGGAPEALPERDEPEPVPDTPVDDYPERPYAEAITDEHRAVLKEAGVTI